MAKEAVYELSVCPELSTCLESSDCPITTMEVGFELLVCPDLSVCPVMTKEDVPLSAALPVMGVVIWCVAAHTIPESLDYPVLLPSLLLPPPLMCPLPSSAPLVWSHHRSASLHRRRGWRIPCLCLQPLIPGIRLGPLPWLIGSPSPPRAPLPPAPPPSVGPLEMSSLPPPWLLPLSAPPWVAFMAVVRVPPGSSCSCSLLSSPWVLPPLSPPWTLFVTLFVVLLTVVRPSPEPPLDLSACLPASPLPSPVTIPLPLLFPPPKSPSIPPAVSAAQGHAFQEGGDMSHYKLLISFLSSCSLTLFSLVYNCHLVQVCLINYVWSP